jgi:hypothetical protein
MEIISCKLPLHDRQAEPVPATIIR